MAGGREHRIRRGAPTTSARQQPVAPSPTASGHDAILGLQRAVGNRVTSSLVVQTKQAYQVGAADDHLEREADQVAAQVMQRLSVGHVGSADRDRPQRKAAAPSVGLEGGPLDESAEKTINASRGKGRPLAKPVLEKMEDGFGADFSGVRVHDDATSDDLANNMTARAFTSGSDIFFRKSEYSPSSAAGQEVLAHELTHVVQQGAAQRKADREV